MGQVVSSEQCPKCAKNGADRSGDNLKRYADGSSYCFACSFSTTTHNTTTRMNKVQLPAVVDNNETGWSSKNLPKSVMDKFGVFRIASEETALQADGTHKYKPTSVLVFPYYDVDTGELIGYKTRDVKKEKRDGIRWVGNSSGMSLFGVGCQPKSASTVVLVEGEPDALAVASVQKDIAVYAIPGAEHTEKTLKKAYRMLNEYKRIILLLDNDEAGQRATEKALAILPKSKVFTAQLPPNFKDVGEMVRDGLSSEVSALLKNAKQVIPPAIVDDNTLLQEFNDAYNGIGASAGISYGFPSLDEASGGLHGGELITVVAGTGSGKSTIVEKIALSIIDQGYNVFFCPLEMMPREVIKKLVQHRTGVPVARPDFKRNEYTDKKTLGVAESILDRCKFMSHFGGMDIDGFLLNCEVAIAMYECKVIVVDHLTALVTASAGGNNVFASDNITSKLKEFALKFDVSIICVSHVSRDSGYDVENKVPQLKHLRGGNGIAQYSDMVIGLGRPRSSKTTDVETIKLHRMVGEHRAFKLNYVNYTLVEAQPDKELETHNEKYVPDESFDEVEAEAPKPQINIPPAQQLEVYAGRPAVKTNMTSFEFGRVLPTNAGEALKMSRAARIGNKELVTA